MWLRACGMYVKFADADWPPANRRLWLSGNAELGCVPMTWEAFSSLEVYEGPGRCGGDIGAIIGGVVGGLFGLLLVFLCIATKGGAGASGVSMPSYGQDFGQE